MEILGLDIGGSGIKGAIVNTLTGELLSERHRIPTPKPATPEAIAKTVRRLVRHFKWQGPVGCCFPTVVRDGKCLMTANLDPSWIGVQIDELFEQACPGTRFYVANDADLAGIAEMSLGAGKGLRGKVIMVTIGTGIGTGVFYNSVLIPNTEFGRMYHPNGEVIELYAADSARKREGLSLKGWAMRFSFFLEELDRIFWPNHIIIGGGISKYYEDFSKHISTHIPISVARFQNNAGIIGAAIFAESGEKTKG